MPKENSFTLPDKGGQRRVHNMDVVWESLITHSSSISSFMIRNFLHGKLDSIPADLPLSCLKILQSIHFALWNLHFNVAIVGLKPPVCA